jgi:CBS domain-containing protein
VATKMRDIMSYAPVCLAATEPVWAAAMAMRDRGIGAVLVIRRGKLSGLITDRDIAVRVLAENRNPLSTQVGDMASAELAVLGPDDDVEQAARLFRERAVRRIPIVRDGRPVGMISFGDLAREARRRSALAQAAAVSPGA